MRFFLVISVVFSFVILFSCKKKVINGLITRGSVEGYIATKNGLFPLGGVLVYIKENSDKKTYSNSEGYFKIDGIPAGQKTVVITIGSVKIEKQVNIEDGKNVAISTRQNPLKLGSHLKIAVVRGSYDRIEEILDTIGFRNVTVPDTGAYVLFNNISQFLNSPYLNDFNVVFINCGAEDEDDFYTNAGMRDNMKSWISNGHSLYCSDFAYTVVEACFPQYIDFYRNDSIAGSARQGFSTVTTSFINDEEIRIHLGKDKANINFSLGWAVISAINQSLGSETWITADSVRTWNEKLYNVPIMVYFSYNQGKVLYTSFHNEAQVTDDMVKILIRIIYEF